MRRNTAEWGTETYMTRNEDSKRANFSEEPHFIDRAYDSVDLTGRIAVSSLEVASARAVHKSVRLTVSPLKGRHTTAL